VWKVDKPIYAFIHVDSIVPRNKRFVDAVSKISTPFNFGESHPTPKTDIRRIADAASIFLGAKP
jgi:hypothetical protein